MELVLHLLGPSHPCKTVQAALARKGLSYEPVVLHSGRHGDEMERIYGPGRRTVPGLLVDGEPVHGSRAILARLEELVPAPPLFPAAIAGRVREAEAWGERELQELGRRLPWGALHFRPEHMGTFGGAGLLDPPGIDAAVGYLRGAWKYHGITAVRLAADLEFLPARIDHVDALAADGVVGGEEPTAADLQLGATLRVLLTLGDVRPLIEGRPAEAVARRWFPDYPGDVPAGAFPAAWTAGWGAPRHAAA